MTAENRTAAPTRTAQRPIQRRNGRLVMMTSLNRYEIDESRKPPGMSYQWCRKTVMGAEDTETQSNDYANGWEPVPPARHPELAGRIDNGKNAIVRGGLILCERPEEITDEVKEMAQIEAKRAVASQIERLYLNGNRAGGRGIKTSYEAPREVPADE